MEQRIESLALIFLLICFFSSTIEVWAYQEDNYIGSPLNMPPYEDVMGPSSSPNYKQNPLYCVYPPLTPNTPSTTFPTPILPNPPSTTFPTPMLPNQSPPPPPFTSTTPPILTPTPPQFPNPTPPLFGPAPPSYEPSPPEFGFGPPSIVPSPPEFVPGPPVFLPPIVYPPPAAPPPPHRASGPGLWCVAKPTVPDPIIQEAMSYACGSGADCDLIQPNGACYQPDTLIAHASFAFNSYWQKTKGAGGNCDFGGTAMLITKDPSYDGCQFILD